MLLVFLVVIVVAILASLKIISDKHEAQAATDKPLPMKSIGFNLDYYDPATQHAGDIHFADSLKQVILSDAIYRKMIVNDFGIQDNRSPDDPTKKNVQPTFILPLGTKVLALVDGEVTRVEKLYSDDWTIWYSANTESTWSYETEHVNSPRVKVGDHVKAGQVVAEVSTHDSNHHPGFGILEIGLFHPLDNQPTHWCPYQHLDSSVKVDVSKKLSAFYDAWEAYIGDSTIYDQESYPIPGCANLDPARG